MKYLSSISNSLVCTLVCSFLSIAVKAEEEKAVSGPANDTQQNEAAGKSRGLSSVDWNALYLKTKEQIAPDYVGLGMSINEAERSNVDGEATGYDIYAGYRVPEKYIDMENIKFGQKTYDLSWIDLYGEIGYSTSGSVEVDLPDIGTRNRSAYRGFWASAFLDMPLADEFSFNTRLGLDVGNDPGWIYGLGGQYNVNKGIGVRVEYLLRDSVQGMHTNLIVKFN